MTGHRREVDFTSALLLGQRHPSRGLRPWAEFTTGLPAGLQESPRAVTLASLVTRQQGGTAGLVARSALHGLTDVFATVPRHGDVVLVDEAAYPLMVWAGWAAAARGVRIVAYPHLRPIGPPPHRRAWYATDGWCQGCCRPAPLARLRELAAPTGGGVIVDDSLAYGVLGRRGGEPPGHVARPDGRSVPDSVFGDGTGTVRWSGLEHDGFLWLASLAKAYGSPVTVITGDGATLARLRDHGGNQWHSSPPSAADLGAALDCVADTDAMGRLRRRSAELVLRLRRDLTGLGLAPQGLPFPLVGLPLPIDVARAWWARLAARGLHTLVQLPRCRDTAVLTAVIRSDHRDEDLDRLVEGFAALTRTTVWSWAS